MVICSATETRASRAAALQGLRVCRGIPGRHLCQVLTPGRLVLASGMVGSGFLLAWGGGENELAHAALSFIRRLSEEN